MENVQEEETTAAMDNNKERDPTKQDRSTSKESDRLETALNLRNTP